jgi:hypothetical protein
MVRTALTTGVSLLNDSEKETQGKIKEKTIVKILK